MNELAPYSFQVTFFTAHFKRHETKKFRSTYILPPPTAIWGIIGGIFGVRRKLENFIEENNLKVGAELIDFKGLITDKVSFMKYERGGYQSTVIDVEFIIEPTFRICIYGELNFIDELKDRIVERNFEYDIYGGISDCLLKSVVPSSEKEVSLERGPETVKGMIPVEYEDGIVLNGVPHNPIIYKVLYFNIFFFQGFNVKFRVKNQFRENILAVNNVIVWGVDDIRRFREGNLE